MEQKQDTTLGPAPAVEVGEALCDAGGQFPCGDMTLGWQALGPHRVVTSGSDSVH